jgi:hypothetical protein
MTGTRPPEATLDDRHHVLVAATAHDRPSLDFFGAVVTADDVAAGRVDVAGKTIYLAGDLERLRGLPLDGAARVLAIDELAGGHAEAGVEVVGLGRVPVRAAGLGVYYRQFFAPGADHFRRVCAEHTFQSLTESVKPSKAHRTGIYLTPVRREGDALHFHLLRCSTNLSGPTEDFAAADRDIVGALNAEAARIFAGHAPLNHVLAQLYPNTAAPPGQKQTKAKISAHADKTKDMPTSGIMAFSTFYDGLDRLAPLAADPFDRGYKGKTGLTRLVFRRKDGAGGEAAALTLTLYPGSVFFMPLSTNRLYTHELQASMLNAEMLPTRLGYVARCSKTCAVHVGGRTFLPRGDALVPLEPATPEGMLALRALYAAENRSSDVIDYGDQFLFSMNARDYLAPHCPRD